MAQPKTAQELRNRLKRIKAYLDIRNIEGRPAAKKQLPEFKDRCERMQARLKEMKLGLVTGTKLEELDDEGKVDQCNLRAEIAKQQKALNLNQQKKSQLAYQAGKLKFEAYQISSLVPGLNMALHLGEGDTIGQVWKSLKKRCSADEWKKIVRN